MIDESSSVSCEPSLEEPIRPRPEDLLEMARAIEEKKKRGRLVIYLGYASGVGKTYSMLYDSLQYRRDGIEVVVGYLETHGRSDTDALAARLETIPLKKIEYQGIILKEVDLDAVLVRRPQVVLIDELAHTNAPESRHEKRYQDIEEILNAGIHVCTTVNIQHIESLNDNISRINGIIVRETVPDTCIQSADEVKLVDISPDELQARLRAGKVYVPDMALQAIRNFFTKGNLLALRQIALRYLAETTDQQMVALMRTRAIRGPWPANERILVAVRPGPYASNLIRAGYRMATRLDADWVVLSVTSEMDSDLTRQEEQWLSEALDLGRTLGAAVVRYRGDDPTNEILRYARQNNVTSLLLGKPKGIHLLFSPVYHLIKQSSGLNLILYDSQGSEEKIPFKDQIPFQFTGDHLLAIILLIGVTILNLELKGIIGEGNLIILQLLPVVVASFFFRRGVALFIAAVSILVFDFTFVPPYHTLSVTDWPYLIAFIGYLSIALVVSTLVSRIRFMLPQILRSEAKADIINGLTRDLSSAEDEGEVFRIIIDHLSRYGPCCIGIFKHHQTGMVLEQGEGFMVDQKELATAWWVYENGVPAGAGTETLSMSKGYYLPMKSNRAVLGVLGIIITDPGFKLSADTKELFDSVAYLGGLAINRVRSLQNDTKE